jgi:eukaryotic-like serine/threonine-protein kinase
MKICPQCHKHFNDQAKYCPKDGSPLTEISDQFLGKVLLGQFEIVELIGEGSMGKVYQAKQISVDRFVAVKVLKKKLRSDPDVFKRFQREAKAAARLSHPNIITVHLVGETEDEKIPYLVMEYVEGASLEIICKAQGALEPIRILKLARQIVSALQEAHSHGVVHRDLKPENISVRLQGTVKEQVKVLDFGIAKILYSDSELSNLTKTGTIFGTPAYISPEQASGDNLDARTDLYSLGVILFRMATGTLPFQDASGLEILVRHIKEIPPRAKSINGDIPDVLDNIIAKLLLKKRDERYSSAEELFVVLDQAIAELGGLPFSENTGPTIQFKKEQLIESSNIVSDDEEIVAGKGLKYFLLVFIIMMVVAAAIFGVLKYLKKGDNSEDVNYQNSKKTEKTNVVKKQVLPKKNAEVIVKKVLLKTEDSKPCDFFFDKPGSDRQTCGGNTVDIKITKKRRQRKILTVDIYIPGVSLEKATFKPLDKKSRLKIFRKRKKITDKDKMFLVVVCRKMGRAEFAVYDAQGKKITDVIIALDASKTIRKHGSMRRNSGRKQALPSLPSFGPPMDVAPIRLPDPPTVMKIEKPPEMKNPVLPTLPDF